MERAYIYARYSSDRQTEQSIEGQLNVCKEYAKQNNIEIIDTFIDRALSAKTDNRPAFQEMIKASNKKLVNYILVYKLDRFARNRYDSATYKAQLKKNGIRLLSATEQISANPEGVILEGMLEAMAEYYSLELAQKIKRGMHESIKKGKFTGGYLLFGYKVVDGYYQVNENQAKFVKKMFKDYIDGKTMVEIAKGLNDKGIRTNFNKPFDHKRLPHLFRNKKYVGISTYQGKTYKNIPPIIDEETFEKVNSLLSSKTGLKKYKRILEPYLLTGKLKCGHCDKNMVAESGRSHTGKVYKYYKCYNKKCSCTKVGKDWLENYVFKKAMLVLNNEALLNSIADGIIKAEQKYVKDTSVLDELKKQRDQVQLRINNVLKAIEEGIITPQTKKRLNQLELELAKHNYKIDVESTKKAVAPTKEEILDFLSRLANKKLSQHSKEIILEAFVQRVIFYDKKTIEIEYKFKIGSGGKGSKTGQGGPPQKIFSNFTITFYRNSFKVEDKKNR